MKKLLAFLTAAVIALSFCSCSGSSDDDFDPDTYVGEGLQTMLAALVDSNQHFYNDVFVLGRLKYNEEKTVKQDGAEWAPVTDTQYPTYESLTDALEETYTEDCVKQILTDYPIYADIDGKLYINLAYAEVTEKGKAWVRSTDREVEFEDKTDEYIELEYKFVAGKSDELDNFKFYVVDGNGQNQTYRLGELQYVD